MKITQTLTTTLILLISLFHLSSSLQWYQHGNPHFINEKDYERLVINPQTRNTGVTILKFFTPWCRYCKYLKDIIDNLRNKDKYTVTVYEVNCDEENHRFCGKMGVHSFPKMKVFENGNLMDTMDGFYPYEVVRELFLKYNRTIVVPPSAAQNHHDQAVKQVRQQEQHQQANAIDPQVVVPVVGNHDKPHQQAKNDKPPKPEQKAEVSPHHAQPTKNNQQQPNANQPQQKKANQPQAPQHPKDQKPAHSQVPKPDPKPIPTNQQSLQHKSGSSQAPNKAKKIQQMIEEEQNIAIMDQDAKETEREKKIVEQLSNQTIDTIDLTKLLPKDEHMHYGKYIIYAICILVGGYYFVHIMKAQPVNESVKQPSSMSHTQKGSNSHIPQKISIQDSQLREQLHFEHPNEEEVNFNSVEIRDEDL